MADAVTALRQKAADKARKWTNKKQAADAQAPNTEVEQELETPSTSAARTYTKLPVLTNVTMQDQQRTLHAYFNLQSAVAPASMQWSDRVVSC